MALVQAVRKLGKKFIKNYTLLKGVHDLVKRHTFLQMKVTKIST